MAPSDRVSCKPPAMRDSSANADGAEAGGTTAAGKPDVVEVAGPQKGASSAAAASNATRSAGNDAAETPENKGQGLATPLATLPLPVTPRVVPPALLSTILPASLPHRCWDSDRGGSGGGGAA